MADENGDETDTDSAATVPDATVDVSAFTAKIEQLTSELAAKDAAIADLGNQLVAAKAVNYDLLMAVPNTETDTDNTTENEEADDDEPDIDDLFGDDK